MRNVQYTVHTATTYQYAAGSNTQHYATVNVWLFIVHLITNTKSFYYRVFTIQLVLTRKILLFYVLYSISESYFSS
jgi:hypothetical protein